MLQSIHIFRKDARHLLPEIAVTLLLFVAFAWAAPSHWTGSVYAGALALLAALLHVLLPIAWLVLISRSIHDEPLVGDRQFWTSRPYHWASLLGAKALFLTAFIYLPFLLVQVYLLHHAGLYPTLLIPALLHNLVLLTAFFVLPIAALAAVTDSFVRLALAVIAAIVYLVIMGGLVAWTTWGNMAPPHVTTVFSALFALLLAAILTFQYATRRTTHARLALVALPALLGLIFCLTPASALIRSSYPALAGSVAPRLSPLPDQLRPKPSPTDPLQQFRGDVLLVLPMQVAGIDENTLFRINGYSLTVDAPGLHWTSPWQLSGEQMNAGTPATYVQVPMPFALFEKVRNTPADLRLTLALDHMKVGNPYIIKATRASFPIPGHGSCSFTNPPDDSSPDAATPVCRFPFAPPETTFIAGAVSPGSCSAPPAAVGHANFGSPSPSLSFDPVQTIPLTLTTGDSNPEHHYLLCPDAQLSIFQAKSQGHGSVQLEQKGALLDVLAARITKMNTQPQTGMDSEPLTADPPARQPQ
ncbi:hypothetical protein FTO74_14875 [Granulicella sp. WH15]|uniref:hypothetical protein n=1 Tax=Granulicella sp. WH15 TaxID=2602070 RepID=UPI0013673DDE|nr:hypothetical protein [Granulicella sp. WH15]QHN04501.1 hypothetical protein FTO74_14875 [Granulicella sp. WH15]